MTQLQSLRVLSVVLPVVFTGERKLLDDPVIVELAEKKGRSPAQIVLRYLLQMGVSIVTRGKV